MIGKKTYPDIIKIFSNIEKTLKDFDKEVKNLDKLLKTLDLALRTSSFEELTKRISKLNEKHERNEHKYILDKSTPADVRFDVARTRLQRLLRAFEDFKKGKDNIDRVKRSFNKLKEVYVCPGCAQIYEYIEELLPELEKNPDETIPIIESYLEGLLFSIEATDVMIERWGYVKPLEELTQEEKDFLRNEVEKRLEKMINLD